MYYAILDLATGEYLARWNDIPEVFADKTKATNCIKRDAVRNSSGDRFIYYGGKIQCPDLGIPDEQLEIVEV